jgi:hypothetical protein
MPVSSEQAAAFTNTVADDTERLAITLNTGMYNKLYLQLDNGFIWRVTNVSGSPAWVKTGAVAIAEVEGPSLPTGGTTGQLLGKASDDDGDADWVTLVASMITDWASAFATAFAAAFATAIGTANIGTGQVTGLDAYAKARVPQLPAWYEETASTGTKKGPVRRVMYDVTVTGVYLNCKTAPTGAALIVDINVGATPDAAGTSIMTTRAQINAAAYSGNSTAIATTNLDAGQYISMDIDQVGSTVAGSGLTVEVAAVRR